MSVSSLKKETECAGISYRALHRTVGTESAIPPGIPTCPCAGLWSQTLPNAGDVSLRAAGELFLHFLFFEFLFLVHFTFVHGGCALVALTGLAFV